MCLWPLCYVNRLNSPIVNLVITEKLLLFYEKAKLVCVIYMPPDKVEFKSVQINMKQVSYMFCRQETIKLRSKIPKFSIQMCMQCFCYTL